MPKLIRDVIGASKHKELMIDQVKTAQLAKTQLKQYMAAVRRRRNRHPTEEDLILLSDLAELLIVLEDMAVRNYQIVQAGNYPLNAGEDDAEEKKILHLNLRRTGTDDE